MICLLVLLIYEEQQACRNEQHLYINGHSTPCCIIAEVLQLPANSMFDEPKPPALHRDEGSNVWRSVMLLRCVSDPW